MAQFELKLMGHNSLMTKSLNRTNVNDSSFAQSDQSRAFADLATVAVPGYLITSQFLTKIFSFEVDPNQHKKDSPSDKNSHVTWAHFSRLFVKKKIPGLTICGIN